VSDPVQELATQLLANATTRTILNQSRPLAEAMAGELISMLPQNRFVRELIATSIERAARQRVDVNEYLEHLPSGRDPQDLDHAVAGIQALSARIKAEAETYRTGEPDD
jgi:hypothetical protein